MSSEITTQDRVIPLSVPNIGGNEWQYVKDCLDTGWISSAGSYVSRFENMVAEYAGAKYGVACVNGTAALHLAMRLLNVQQGDHILVPNITFIATINSIVYHNAEPILIDADQNTWQMDLDLLEEFLSDQVEMRENQAFYRQSNRPIRAIMPVHVLGNMVDMDRLMALARKYHLQVIEDAAESLGSRYKGKHSGTFGEIGCFSFNGNKIISTGGGGVIVTNDEGHARQAKHLSQQAKPNPHSYDHDQVGYNYRLVNILAAVGVAQMEQLDGFLQRKREVINYYKSELNGVADIGFQEIRPEVECNGWLFTISSRYQPELLRALNAKKIISRPFWVPMNQLPMFQNLTYFHRADVSDQIFRSCLSIPSSTNITDEELEIVVHEIKRILS